jgi:hypothetical protein
MGTVHDLLATHGKQGALNLDMSRETVEAAAGYSYMADEDGRIGFLYSGWCQTALPHKRQPDDAVWTVQSGHITLVVEPGRRLVRGTETEWVGVPYGARARLILLYLQSEALRTSSPEVELGKTMRGWMERVGIPWGGKSVAMVREQAERISRCKLTFHIDRGTKVGLLNQSIIDEALFEKDGTGHGRFATKAVLSDRFFKQLKKHPVPLDESAIRQIANNSQALDVYCWLAYRLHALTAPTPLSWIALKGQFGLGVGRLQAFREMFRDSLALALAVYPDARVDITDTGLLLHPSRPPVAPKQFQVAVA